MDSLAKTVMVTLALLVLHHSSVPAAAKQDFMKECPPSRCSEDGPEVRFPLRLNTSLPNCGCGSLVLTCSGNHTVLRLPSSDEYNVTSINYKESYLTITRSSWTPCHWLHMKEPDVTGSLFNNFSSMSVCWFNCTSTLTTLSGVASYLVSPISCLGSQGHYIYIIQGNFLFDQLPSTCTKMRNDSILRSPPVPDDGRHFPPEGYQEFKDLVQETIVRSLLRLSWQDNLINCTICEKKGRVCQFNTELKKSVCGSKDSHVAMIAGISFGALCILLGGISYFCIAQQSRKKKIARHKIELFLRNYKVMNPLRYTYAELMKITNGFSKRVGNGRFGTVYEGKLSSGIPVAVKVLDISNGNGDLFVNEVATIGRIHHVNVVRLLGYCYEGKNRALIYEFMENGSLDKYMFSSKGRSHQFNMEEMFAIAMSVAEGIKYLHQGCDHRILHFDIKPNNILMDHNFVPKISDFGLSKLCPKDKSYVTMSAARGTMGYLAPEMYSRNFGTVSYKSDVYSFGMLLLEMISGRKNMEPPRDGPVEGYFPDWIYDQLAQGKNLCSSIDMEYDEEIIRKLGIVALWCIQWSPEDRPSMTKVVQMLGENLHKLQMPPKPAINYSSYNNIILSSDQIIDLGS